MLRLLRAALDPFLLLIIATLVVAILLPLSDQALTVARWASTIAIGVLFFAYGLRLPTSEVVSGLRNWKLQLAIMVCTFVLYPLLGLAAAPLAEPLLGSALAAGVLFTMLLPSTVNSSVAMTSIARGNVPGALTAATVSNVAGIVLTPALVLLAMGSQADASGGLQIVFQLLVPFILGQLLSRWTGDWMRRHRPLTLSIDRGTIVLAVFSAVASATASGVWDGVTASQILSLVLVSAALLALMVAGTWWGGGLVQMPYQDRVAFLLCGSQKSLATGLPMGLVLFPAETAATMVVPIVVFHQLQLIVATIISNELSRRPAP